MKKLIVKDTEITITQIESEDYICITDMLKAKDGDFFVTDWLRNRNTLEYIGTWEKVYNPNFNYDEFKELYYAYDDYVDFVISCKGSYNTYTEDLSKKSSVLMESYREIKVELLGE